mmetsp:Transcript_3852/g.5853  ORF Transcript_3852/g.5853 Transcript_3852/m.5853 type:complete len:593 (+) Transcript_3852:4584-6362(+)
MLFSRGQRRVMIFFLLLIHSTANEDWQWSGQLQCGEGIGHCVVANDNTVKNVLVTVEIQNNSNHTFRFRSPRAHCYVALFALDARRDVIQFVSQVKTRPGEHVELNLTKLPRGGSLHALVASNAITDDDSPEYFVRIRGAGLSQGYEDGCGWRGLEPAIYRDDEISLPAPKRLICIDGGGARGVVPLAIMQQAEQRCQSRVREKFDFFAGTSTGAIIAAGLAIAELPTAIVDAAYRDLARLIFGSRGLSASQRGKRLKAVLSAVFGAESKLKQSTSHSRRVLFVATDASTSTLRPLVLRNYRRGLDPDDDYESDMRLVDALLASAAAPPYFPAVEKSRRKLLDGALVANNPTLVALIDAAALGVHDPEVVVSLGTGIAPVKAARRNNGIFSALEFVTGIINLITNTDNAHDLVDLYLRANRAYRRTSTRYHRLDVVIDPAHLDLAQGDGDALTDLKSLALDYLRREKPHHWRALLRELDESSNVVELDDLIETRLLLSSRQEGETLSPLHGSPSSTTHSSTTLRSLRKRTAKLTGMHGFFSGKKTNRNPKEDDTSSSSSSGGTITTYPSSSAVVVVKTTGGGSSIINKRKGG